MEFGNLDELLQSSKKGINLKSSIDCCRPVSFLCSTSKVFEKLMSDTIYSKVGHTFFENQFGFRRKRSAILQLLAVLKSVYEYYDNIDVKELAILYLDSEKAFDKVPHGPLISKLSQIVINGKVL